MKRKHVIAVLVLAVLLYLLWRHHVATGGTSVTLRINDNTLPEINGQTIQSDLYTFGNNLVRSYNRFV